MKSILKTLLTGLTVAGAVAGVQAAGAPKPVVAHVQKGSFPVMTLTDRQSGGQRAVDLLGTRLPTVAAWYRKSPDEFKALLLNDRRLRLDQRGRLFAVDELQQPLAATTATAASPGLLDGTLAPLDQTFLLHSRPGAKRTIYLNFKGATLTGTGWNASTGVTTITAQPFDLDGIPGSFTTTELQRIQYIWQRVAEDYAPFDVDVTTEAPPADALTRADSTDTIFGTTVLITNSSGVYSCSCGGVAYIGAFDDIGDTYKPALVFYDKLGPGNEKYIAEAISHEAGHNMGLNHDGTFDGTTTVGYYTGHGSGVTGWAPIMGVGYYQPLVQWSRGEYLYANNTQDDFAVMQSYGLPLRLDDHGDTMATATVLTGTSSGGITTVSATGVIERSTDVDMFTFAAAAGPLNLTLTPAVRAANLDALVTVRNSAGVVIATANPVDALNATLSVTLPAAGTYHVAVQGTGKGDPLTTGYGSYGSVGQYALSASYYTSGNVAPTAAISATPTSGTAPLTVQLSGAGSTDPDGGIAGWAWTFGDGTTGTGSALSHVYSSAGTYTVQLQVTDTGGLTATTSTTITVGAPVVAMSVNNIAMTLTVAKTGTATATAAVKVLDASGKVVPGATVTGNWSGIVSKTGATATTATSTGVATLTSPTAAKTARGTFTFTVTGVTKTGYGYVSASNLETSDSIAR